MTCSGVVVHTGDELGPYLRYETKCFLWARWARERCVVYMRSATKCFLWTPVMYVTATASCR